MHSSDRAPHKGPMRTFAQTLLILVLVASVASLMAWAHSRVTRSSDHTAAQQATVGRAGESRADEITPEPSPDWIRSNSAVWDAKRDPGKRGSADGFTAGPGRVYGPGEARCI
jgi:hypothetical protein